MACFMPFSSRNLDVSFLVLKPTVVVVDQLVEALRHFSSWTETLGCIHSAILQSIHGNMIIWYGAWMKRSDENKKLLNAVLVSTLTNVISRMAVLTDYNFFEAYAGESRNGSAAAKFSTGDTVSLSVIAHSSDDKNQIDLPYAILATFRSRFSTMDDAISGVCLKKCGDNKSKSKVTNDSDFILNFYVWKSLQSCYSYILRSDIKDVIVPYLRGLSLELKYDIFRVIYVSGDDVLNAQYSLWPPHMMLQANDKNNV